jgi:hypothetical protein
MQAAGKSTIGPLLASRLGPPAATIDGDVFYHAVVAGEVGMTPQVVLNPSVNAIVEPRCAATSVWVIEGCCGLGDYEV